MCCFPSRPYRVKKKLSKEKGSKGGGVRKSEEQIKILITAPVSVIEAESKNQRRFLRANYGYRYETRASSGLEVHLGVNGGREA